jgi:5,10-methylenetetrahydromethanopterin reductase
VIAIAARHADRIMFTLGADVERLAWGIETARQAAVAHGRDPATLRYGAYVNLACHEDIEIARSLVQGGLTTFARFSVMHGKIAGPVDTAQADILKRLHDTYNMKQHTRGDSQQAQVLTPEFIDRFAITGDPATCRERINQLSALGIDKLAISGPTFAAKSESAQHAAALLETEILHNGV